MCTQIISLLSTVFLFLSHLIYYSLVSVYELCLWFVSHFRESVFFLLFFYRSFLRVCNKTSMCKQSSDRIKQSLIYRQVKLNEIQKPSCFFVTKNMESWSVSRHNAMQFLQTNPGHFLIVRLVFFWCFPNVAFILDPLILHKLKYT